MLKKPFFSIVLHTYNQSEFLKKCINSILFQTFKNWELIIINNNSIDDTLRVIKNFNDKRIRTFNINNQGILGKSRNLGIKKSKSDWICFIDTDDKWYPKKLEEVKIYIENTKGVLFYHDLEFENKNFLFIKKKIKDKSNSITKPIIKYFAKNGNPIGYSSVVVKKKILKKVNLVSVKKDKFSWEDFDLWIKIAMKTENFVRIPKILGSIWIGNENLSSLDQQIINTQNIKKNYNKLFYKFVDKKDKNKNLWWLEYPSILKEFRNKNIKNFLNLIDKISKPPIKFMIFLKFAEYYFIVLKNLRSLKKIFSLIILYKNDKFFSYKILVKKNYKIADNIKVLKKIKFDNFDIPKFFFKRINKNNKFHFIYKNKNLITYGWSSKDKRFHISEIDRYLVNNDNIIFYDFKTLKEFQRKGHYKSLLKFMLMTFKKNNCFIYSTLFNTISVGAIEKSHFKFIKILSAFKKYYQLKD